MPKSGVVKCFDWEKQEALMQAVSGHEHQKS